MTNIIEMFKSIQGEGIHIGVPSIFIRFSSCNLTCPEDLEKIKFLINTQTIDKQIIIQPDGNRKDYNIACRELADWVNENEMTQVRVLPQFHRLCWGQKRGI